MYERIYAKNTAAAPKLIAHRGLAVDHPQNTLSVQEIGKAIIALHILRDAMHNLEHRPYL